MAQKSAPRTMADHRRREALTLRIIAGALLLCACILPFCLPFLPAVGIALFLLAAARAFQVASNTEIDAAKRAESGVVGEDETARELLKLCSGGWTTRRNVDATYLGDIDFLVSSPLGRQFVIEVKSHKGIILRDEDGLFRRVGYKMYPLERDPLKATLRQAEYVREELNGTDVVPVLCFTRAEIGLNSRDIDGVHIVRLDELLAFLQKANLEKRKPTRKRSKSGARR